MTSLIEVNLVTLPSSTYFHGGLSPGNFASINNKGLISYPKKAALQCLSLIKMSHDNGIPHILLPPHPRPNQKFLKDMGFSGNQEHVLQKIKSTYPDLIPILYSNAYIWTANMATFTPSCDSKDKKIHLTPANLITHPHRAQETPHSQKLLKAVFSENTIHHSPIQYGLGDEGGANHIRLSSRDFQNGLNIFVYSKKRTHSRHDIPRRQSYEACIQLKNKHQLSSSNTLIIEQNQKAIDLGVFHNDVIAIANQDVLICHEMAFQAPQQIQEIKETYQKMMGSKLIVEHIQNSELSLEEAVRTYFFNAQLITKKDGSMVFMLPHTCKSNKRVQKICTSLLSHDNRIKEIQYINLSESLKNGGGPACLRLRVWLTPQEFNKLPQNLLLTKEKLAALKASIQSEYPTEHVLNSLI